MINVKFGSIVRHLRTSAKMSQETLAELIGVHTTTISRIENDETGASVKLRDIIFEKFGIDKSNILAFFPTIKEIEFAKYKDKIDELMLNREFNEASFLLDKLEKNKNLSSKSLNKQYILYVKAILCRDKNPKSGQIYNLLKQSMKQSIKNFEEKNMPYYYYSNQDINVLNLMSVNCAENDNLQGAIEILKSLKKSIDDNYIDNNFKGRHLPAIIYNITKLLIEIERYEESLNLCNEGIDICISTRYFFVLPLLTFNKIDILSILGHKIDIEESLAEVFSTCILFKKFDYAWEIKKDAEKKYGIILNSSKLQYMEEQFHQVHQNLPQKTIQPKATREE